MANFGVSDQRLTRRTTNDSARHHDECGRKMGKFWHRPKVKVIPRGSLVRVVGRLLSWLAGWLASCSSVLWLVRSVGVSGPVWGWKRSRRPGRIELEIYHFLRVEICQGHWFEWKEVWCLEMLVTLFLDIRKNTNIKLSYFFILNFLKKICGFFFVNFPGITKLTRRHTFS